QSCRLNADHARRAAGPSIRPTVSSRQTSSQACKSAGVSTSPDAVAASRPSEYPKPPMGNRLSQRCRRASRGRDTIVSIMMMMVGHRRCRRERERRVRKRNVLLLEELQGAGHVRADDSRFGDHQREVPIANVVREQTPLLARARFNEEYRLGPLEDDD